MIIASFERLITNGSPIDDCIQVNWNTLTEQGNAGLEPFYEDDVDKIVSFLETLIGEFTTVPHPSLPG